MKKYLRVEYTRLANDETDGEIILLEGDHRQTNDRMLEHLIRRKLGPSFEDGETQNEYSSDQGRMKIKSVESVPLSEVEDVKSSTFTLVVNEHVTDPACRVSYSGEVPGV